MRLAVSAGRLRSEHEFELLEIVRTRFIRLGQNDARVVNRPAFVSIIQLFGIRVKLQRPIVEKHALDLLVCHSGGTTSSTLKILLFGAPL